MATEGTFITYDKKWMQEKKQILKEKFLKLVLTVPIFQALSTNMLDIVADSFTEINFKRNDIIIQVIRIIQERMKIYHNLTQFRVIKSFYPLKK